VTTNSRSLPFSIASGRVSSKREPKISDGGVASRRIFLRGQKDRVRKNASKERPLGAKKSLARRWGNRPASDQSWVAEQGVGNAI